MKLANLVPLLQIVSLVLLMVSFFLHIDWAMIVAVVLLLLASALHFYRRTKK